jgi:hypothetical protein
MGFLSGLFGSKQAATQPPSPLDEVKRQIESAEGELHEAQEQLAATADPEIKTSLEFLVTRKTQALKDLQDKLTSLTK